MSNEKKWWHRFPFYGDVHDIERIKKLKLRIVPSDGGADPGWGPYAQMQNPAETSKKAKALKEIGAHAVSWLEAFGTCMPYAAAFSKTPDGEFVSVDESKMAEFAKVLDDMIKDGDKYTLMSFNSWTWDKNIEKDKYSFYWAGPHNVVNDEEFLPDCLRRDRYGMAMPTYPDGSEAVGTADNGECYPLNAKFYDAVCSKDINGQIDRFGEGLAKPEIADPKKTEPDKIITEGLYKMIVTENCKMFAPGCEIGDEVYLSVFGIGKDPAAPFWTEYYKASAKNVCKMDLGGMWVDNCSPFNNFGVVPIQNGFGDWAVYKFKAYIKEKFDAKELAELGINDTDAFDVRLYLKDKATEFGATDPTIYADKAWCDSRWLDEPIWRAYRAFKQKMGQYGLKNMYSAYSEVRESLGREDLMLFGNDSPWTYGYIHEDVIDMISAEITPVWSIMGGGRGFMKPPYGRMSPLYRTARAHLSAPYSTFWYYDADKNTQNNPGQARVLFAEAFSAHAFLKYGENSRYPGDDESVIWWNTFLESHEDELLGRKDHADIGLLFSPDNNLAFVVPGHFTLNHDRQPHVFAHWGFATAMLDAHISYKVVTDWRITEESLKGLKTFILPHAECLDEKSAAVITRWVEDGGRLVITGPTGMRDIADTDVKGGMFKLRNNSILDHLVSDKGLKIHGDGINGQDGGRISFMVMDATDVRTFEDGSTTKAEKVEESIEIYKNKYGKGCVLFTPFNYGMKYYLAESDRKNQIETMTEIIGSSDISTGDMPYTVSLNTFISEDGKSMYADLVNYNINIETDVVTPEKELKFTININKASADVQLKLLTPDVNCTAVIESVISNNEDISVDVKVNNLTHYASVILTY